MKEYSNHDHVIRHKVEITQIRNLFIVTIDGLRLMRKGDEEQATFKTSQAAYDAAEKAIAKARS